MEYLTDDEEFLELVEAVRTQKRSPQEFKNRPNQFEEWDDGKFLERFRLSKTSVNDLITHISPEIQSKTDRNHALSPAEMIFVTLSYLANGCFLRVSGDLNGVHKSTASRAVDKVLKAIARLGKIYIKMPKTPAELQAVRSGFYLISKFPRCIGSIDCTHIKINSPGGENPELYRNRKGYFSLNVQAVCDSKLNIQDVVCQWPGSAHDSNIFANCSLKQRFESGEFGSCLLVGDSGYGIRNYLITPLRNPQTNGENLFNESQIRTRNPIERCFGVIKKRFPILSLGINIKVAKVDALVVACAVLHNIALSNNDALPTSEEGLDAEIAADIEMGNHEIGNFIGNNKTRLALINYFNDLL